jgi:DNA-binding winged helix-turn-helix (wHTH) protein
MVPMTEQFGPFYFESGQLLRDGELLRIGQRGIALLQAMLETDGPVSKQVLVEAAWPDVTVSAGNLPVQIAALRRTLGARDNGQGWIITIPQYGYQLVR